ncbi:MAG: hypothetical protein JO239_05140 [Paraburkholderia sp.]|nr:hypothetical protein [Paraburkholderia sp.]
MMREVAVSVRHACGFRIAAMIPSHNHGFRLRNTLCVLACRGTAHGNEREQASKKKTTQKSHATWERVGWADTHHDIAP